MSLQSAIDRSSQHDPLVDFSTGDVTIPPDACTTTITAQRLKTLLMMGSDRERLVRKLVQIMITELVPELFRRLVPRIQPLDRAAYRCTEFGDRTALLMTADLVSLLRLTAYLHDRDAERDLMYLITVLQCIENCEAASVLKSGKLDKPRFLNTVQHLCEVMARRIEHQNINQLFVDYMFRVAAVG